MTARRVPRCLHLASLLLVAAAIPSPALAADPPTVLRLATSEDYDRPSQPLLDRFVSEVEARSGGSMTVELIYAAGGHGPDRDVASARRIQSGDVDLALIPSRAYADIGATGIDALMAPFLIDNDALFHAVGADHAVIEPILAGLAEIGLVGLALWPESLRYLFTFEENGPPILAPTDLAGDTIFTIGSSTQNEVMRALGATPSNEYPIEARVRDGTLRGAEYSLRFFNLYSPKPTVTADVVLYPKFMTLVAEDATWSRFSEEQQQIIRESVVVARDALVADMAPETALVADWCAQGGRVVLAGEANVAAFRAAVQSVYDRMRADPQAAAAIDAIEALKAATPPGPAPVACEPQVQPTAVPVEVGAPIDLLPSGTYVTDNPRALLAERGMTAMDAGSNAGSWTWRVAGTTGAWEILHRDGQHEVCPVTFTLQVDRIRGEGCDEWMEFRWQLDGDQLTVTVVSAGPPPGDRYMTTAYQALFEGPWTKVE